MTFGTRLQKLRKEKKISQKEIATIIDVSQTIYGKWESDIFFPTYKNLQKLSHFYMIDIHSLTEKNDVENFLKDPFDNLNTLKSISKISKNIETLVLLISRQNELLEKEENLSFKILKSD